MNWLLNAKQVQNKTHSKLCCLLVLTSLYISPSEKEKKKGLHYIYVQLNQTTLIKKYTSINSVLSLNAKRIIVLDLEADIVPPLGSTKDKIINSGHGVMHNGV